MRRSWRWLVVLRDLPPLPPYTEVLDGHLTRRGAEHEARMFRLALNRQVAMGTVSVTVERRPRSR